MADSLTVSLRQVQGSSLVARTGSGHWVAMDTSAAGGGAGAAPTPMEMVLMALAGCTAMDVIGMLRKMRAPLQGLEIEAAAERAEEHPRVFTKATLLYRFHGDLDSRQVERAIALSHETYCSVSAMLKPQVAIEHRYEIIRDGISSDRSAA